MISVRAAQTHILDRVTTIASPELLPLVASAGQGDKGPFTLRMKFKQGDVLKYQVNMQMVMAIIMPNQPQPMTMPSNSSMVLEQKVDKLLPNGGAEVTMTTKNQQATRATSVSLLHQTR